LLRESKQRRFSKRHLSTWPADFLISIYEALALVTFEGKDEHACLMALGYQRWALDKSVLVRVGGSLLLFTWLGDRVNEALIAMLRQRGFVSMGVGPAIEITGQMADEDRVVNLLNELAINASPSADILLADAFNLRQEKWDWALPDAQLVDTFASLRLDVEGAHDWLRENQQVFSQVTS
jgi:hypothetical protein